MSSSGTISNATGRETSIPPVGDRRKPVAVLPEETHGNGHDANHRTIEDQIKHSRREGLKANQKAREEQSARNGRYVLAADVAQELGRNSARLLTLFESAVTEMAQAIAAEGSQLDHRGLLRVMRGTWNTIRAKAAETAAAEAAQLPPLVADSEETI